MSLNATDQAIRVAKRYREALMSIYERYGWCERLTFPSECRDRAGYPREEWCQTCIAAEALGIETVRPRPEPKP